MWLTSHLKHSYTNCSQKVDDIDLLRYTRYINLDKRLDRKEHIEQQIKNMQIATAQRFSAIQHAKGLVGCVRSHIAILEEALAHPDAPEYVCVLEDDAVFLNPGETIAKLQRVHQNHSDWDVILLGGNNFPPYKTVDADCVQVTNCQTTHAYVVKRRFIPELLENFRTGLQGLLRTSQDRFALDQHWKHLQKKHKFLLLQPMRVDQLEGHSDISQQNVRYDLHDRQKWEDYIPPVV
jgi:glycosyl transferase family 25